MRERAVGDGVQKERARVREREERKHSFIPPCRQVIAPEQLVVFSNYILFFSSKNEQFS